MNERREIPYEIYVPLWHGDDPRDGQMFRCHYEEPAHVAEEFLKSQSWDYDPESESHEVWVKGSSDDDWHKFTLYGELHLEFHATPITDN